MSPQRCVKGTMHQGSARFAEESRGKQCTPISFLSVLYSSVVSVEQWSPETVDLVLFHGDELYQSVRHDHAYFDYTELPLSLSIPGSDLVLSCSFGSHSSGFMHCSESRPGFLNFPDALSASCESSLGCLVTVNQTTVAVMKHSDLFYVFDPHSRNEFGLAEAGGTAVLIC